MKILDRYYQIVDRPTDEVNKLWKYLQLTLLAIEAVSGYIASFAFSSLLTQFGKNCILYSELKLEIIDPYVVDKDQHWNENADHNMINETDLSHYGINEIETDWGDDWVCRFCESVPLFSVVLATVLLAFFTLFPKGGTNYTKSSVDYPWHLVIPSLIVTGMHLSLVLTSNIYLLDGTKIFREQFENYFNKTLDDCEEVLDNISDQLTNTKSPIFFSIIRNFDYSIMFSYLSLLSWIFGFLILLLRIILVVDFKILDVTIFIPDEIDASSTEPIISSQNLHSETLFGHTTKSTTKL